MEKKLDIQKDLGIGREIMAFAAFLYLLASLHTAWAGSLF
jgi:hypothetical protein